MPLTSHFKKEVFLRIVPKGWEVGVQDIHYYSEILGRWVIVPVGFFTDLASVPMGFRWLIRVANARNRKAAIVHDYLCDPDVQRVYEITQKDADAVFMEALEVCGLNVVGRYAMWAPVRFYQWVKHDLL